LQQVADLEEIAVLRQLLDRVAAVEQDPLVAVDVGDGRAAARGGEESRVVGEGARLAVEGADVDHVGSDAPGQHRKFEGLAVGKLQRCDFVSHIVALGGAQPCHSLLQSRVVAFATADDDVPEIVVGQLEQGLQRLHILIPQYGDETLQYDVELEQAPAAFPVEPVVRHAIHQTARLTMISLILPMARVGLRPFGQTSTQFMMVWQRNRRYGSSRLSRRSAVAWSRESAMKRYACKSPAGPTNL